jgi:hypothetical protein
MSIHFEYGPNEKASLRKLVGLCDVALALIRERRQLLKLLRENPGSEKRNNVVSATFERLQDLEQVSHLIQLAFRDPVGNKDGGGAVEAVGVRLEGNSRPSQCARNTPAKCRTDPAPGWRIYRA